MAVALTSLIGSILCALSLDAVVVCATTKSTAPSMKKFDGISVNANE